jgi:hypothetical protein
MSGRGAATPRPMSNGGVYAFERNAGSGEEDENIRDPRDDGSTAETMVEIAADAMRGVRPIEYLDAGPCSIEFAFGAGDLEAVPVYAWEGLEPVAIPLGKEGLERLGSQSSDGRSVKRRYSSRGAGSAGPASRSPSSSTLRSLLQTRIEVVDSLWRGLRREIKRQQVWEAELQSPKCRMDTATRLLLADLIVDLKAELAREDVQAALAGLRELKTACAKALGQSRMGLSLCAGFLKRYNRRRVLIYSCIATMKGMNDTMDLNGAQTFSPKRSRDYETYVPMFDTDMDYLNNPPNTTPGALMYDGDDPISLTEEDLQRQQLLMLYQKHESHQISQPPPWSLDGGSQHAESWEHERSVTVALSRSASFDNFWKCQDGKREREQRRAQICGLSFDPHGFSFYAPTEKGMLHMSEAPVVSQNSKKQRETRIDGTAPTPPSLPSRTAHREGDALAAIAEDSASTNISPVPRVNSLMEAAIKRTGTAVSAAANAGLSQGPSVASAVAPYAAAGITSVTAGLAAHAANKSAQAAVKVATTQQTNYELALRKDQREEEEHEWKREEHKRAADPDTVAEERAYEERRKRLFGSRLDPEDLKTRKRAQAAEEKRRAEEHDLAQRRAQTEEERQRQIHEAAQRRLDEVHRANQARKQDSHRRAMHAWDLRNKAKRMLMRGLGKRKRQPQRYVIQADRSDSWSETGTDSEVGSVKRKRKGKQADRSETWSTNEAEGSAHYAESYKDDGMAPGDCENALSPDPIVVLHELDAGTEPALVDRFERLRQPASSPRARPQYPADAANHPWIALLTEACGGPEGGLLGWGDASVAHAHISFGARVTAREPLVNEDARVSGQCVPPPDPLQRTPLDDGDCLRNASDDNRLASTSEYPWLTVDSQTPIHLESNVSTEHGSTARNKVSGSLGSTGSSTPLESTGRSWESEIHLGHGFTTSPGIAIRNGSLVALTDTSQHRAVSPEPTFGEQGAHCYLLQSRLHPEGRNTTSAEPRASETDDSTELQAKPPVNTSADLQEADVLQGDTIGVAIGHRSPVWVEPPNLIQ